MKRNKKITLLVLSLTSILAASCSSPNITSSSSKSSTTSSSSGKEVSFVSKDVNCYVLTSKNKTTFKVYFSSEKEGIPYIDVNDIPSFMSNLYGSPHNAASYTVTSQGDTYYISREASNGAYAAWDFKTGTFYASNRSKYILETYRPYSIDLVTTDGHFYDDNGNAIEDQVRFISRKTNSVVTQNRPVSVNLNDYDIDLYSSDSVHLIPLSTYFDLCCKCSVALSYNGYDFFITSTNLDKTTLDEDGKSQFDYYYAHSEDSTRSEELIKFNYSELCLNFDMSYGLKEGHNITSGFDEYFASSGIKQLLLSKDKQDVDKAYLMMQVSYLSDYHTGYNVQMPYEGYVDNEVQTLINEVPISPGYFYKLRADQQRTAQRTYYGNLKEDGSVAQPFQVVGDTAIITFDHFLMPIGIDNYYSQDFLNNKEAYIAYDTVALISYAQDRIMANPSIKRVVIDLSGNGGGAIDAAAFMLGWLDSGLINVQNSIDGGQSSIGYLADVNFDKTIGQEDFLDNYVNDIYCLISPASFSSGNLVPNMLKQTGMVKLIGTQSGGGACAVKISALPDGTIFQFSSYNVLSTTKNGSYYDIDRGAEPDYYLSDYKTLYGGTVVEGLDVGNRANLLNYIDQLV